MEIEWLPLSDIKPYERNARNIPEVAVDKVAMSLKEYGWRQPIVCDEGNVIVAGHARLLAAQKLGYDQAPVHVAKELSEAQIKAYRLADNRTHQETDWDFALLGPELSDLEAMDFDLALTGFDPTEIDAAKAKADAHEGLTDPDAIPEPPEEPIAVLGDVWRLGRHTLVCGDSTDADAVAKCLGDVKPHLMVTDPPYGVEYDADWRTTARNANGKLLSTGDDRAVGKVQNDDRGDWSEAWALFPGDVAYVWHGGSKAHIVAESLIEGGLEIRAQIIWAKNNIVIGRGHYHPKHEPLWYAVRKGATGHWEGGRKQSTVWDIDKPMKSETGHSTQKPVECMKRPIENNSSPGQAVYEPFSGSGTTIIAAEMTGRACHAIELNPAYVDIAVKRWEDFTGETATRD